MSEIRIFFANGTSVKMDRDRTDFKDGDGSLFSFRLDDGDEPARYEDIITDGRTLVNWSNVAYVRGVPDETTEDDEE